MIAAIHKIIAKLENFLGKQHAKPKQYSITGTVRVYEKDLDDDQIEIIKRNNGIRRVMVKEVALSSNSKRRDQQLREAVMHSQLEHENIVPLLHSYRDKSKVLCLVMPVMQMDMAKLIKLVAERKVQLRGFSSHRAWVECVAKDVAKALCYMHKRKICHGDFKPGNLLVNLLPFKVCVCDFGASQVERSNTCGISKAEVHSNHYSPPEVKLNIIDSYSFRVQCSADVYGIGILIGEMLVLEQHKSQCASVWLDKRQVHVHHQALPFTDEDLQRSGCERQDVLIQAYRLCTRIDPSSRPSMPQVLDLLEGRLDPKSLEASDTGRLSSTAEIPRDSGIVEIAFNGREDGQDQAAKCTQEQKDRQPALRLLGYIEPLPREICRWTITRHVTGQYYECHRTLALEDNGISNHDAAVISFIPMQQANSGQQGWYMTSTNNVFKWRRTGSFDFRHAVDGKIGPLWDGDIIVLGNSSLVFRKLRVDEPTV